ncbi:reverse transcriptase domain-containing protein [Tanacetum coccineum]
MNHGMLIILTISLERSYLRIGRLKREGDFSLKLSAFKLCSDNVMRRCVAGNEILEILAHCHSRPTRGHHSVSITGRKVYESGFYWPSIFKDAKDYVMKCDAC